MNINDPNAFKNAGQTSQKGAEQKGSRPIPPSSPLGMGNARKAKNVYAYAVSHKEEVMTYFLLTLGLLLLLFFHNLLGGLIIGMVAGYFFASEIVYYIGNLGQVIRGREPLSYVILTALLLGLFIAAPGIFIGALIVAAFKQVIGGNA